MYELPEAPIINVPFTPPGYDAGWIDPLNTGVQLTTSTSIMQTQWEKIQAWLASHQNIVIGAVGIVVLLTVVGDGKGRRR